MQTAVEEQDDEVQQLSRTIEDRQAVQEGLSDRQVAEQVGLSIHTVRKWRRKLKGGQKSSALSQMGRPKRGALSSYPQAMGEQIKEWCTQHPGWGAKTLRAEFC